MSKLKIFIGSLVCVLLLAGCGGNKEAKLLSAVWRSDVSAVRKLIKSGADVNVNTGKGNTPLMLAVTQGNSEIMRMLLEAGADANAKDSYGAPILKWAISWSPLTKPHADENAVRLLLEFGADVNATDKDKVTPLMIAALLGRTEVVRLLIEAGADVNAKDRGNGTALQRGKAMSRGGANSEIVRMLRQAGAK